MVICVPTGPLVGEILVTCGTGTLKSTLAALASPAAVTLSGPVIAPTGTVTVIWVLDQLETEADTVEFWAALKLTEPVLLVKLLPVMVTEVPGSPLAGESEAITGATVKAAPLLANPPLFTTILPVVAPPGTAAVMLVLVQEEMIAARPLKLTPLALGPKLLPEMVTTTPGPPLVGLTLLTLGAFTVKATLLLATLFTVTTTLPLPAATPLGTEAVMLPALQALTAAVTPPKVTVLVPWLEPKLLPAMVTDPPIGPEVGDRLLMAGADCAWPVWASIATNNTKLKLALIMKDFISQLSPAKFIVDRSR
jgi:hypothetical protein